MPQFVPQFRQAGAGANQILAARLAAQCTNPTQPPESIFVDLHLARLLYHFDADARMPEWREGVPCAYFFGTCIVMLRYFMPPV